jgi:hypothetical protein
MDLLIRNLAGLEPLWEAALPAAVAFASTLDTLPAKAERYVHRIRLIDEAGHVSAGAAILPQLVRVPSLASPVSPSFALSGGSSGTLALAARVRDSFDLKWLVLFTLSQTIPKRPTSGRSTSRSCFACRAAATVSDERHPVPARGRHRARTGGGRCRDRHIRGS